jgi:hypothetical protein
MIFDPYWRFMPQDFVFKIARTPSELDGYWALRRPIFCYEQGLVEGTDQDDIDERALPIVCQSLVARPEKTGGYAAWRSGVACRPGYHRANVKRHSPFKTWQRI